MPDIAEERVVLATLTPVEWRLLYDAVAERVATFQRISNDPKSTPVICETVQKQAETLIGAISKLA